ncbi:MAG TPA: hypothetical protein V6C81_10560 [Planktothrix sp.]|jgi:hypothetical protein
MNQDRHHFFEQFAAACGTGIASPLAGSLGGLAETPIEAASGAVVAGAVSGAYGIGVRTRVFEVIVHQALLGTPWKEVCKGPMAVNRITEEEIEAEVKRRTPIRHASQAICWCPLCQQKQNDSRIEASKRIDAIPHSPLSPCACKGCRNKVREILAKSWSDAKQST